MPIIMSYTFQGTTHPNSFWVITGLNVNVAMKTATLVMTGYDTEAAFESAPTSPLDVKIFTVSTPSKFDQYVGKMNRAGSLYETDLMNWLTIGLPEGFTGSATFFATGSVYSPVTFDSAEIGFDPASGPSSEVKLFVTFTDNIDTAGNYTTGVTIKVNGSPVTISSGARQVNTKIVLYTLAVAVGNGDSLTFEYIIPPGQITDSLSDAILPILPKTVSNNLGEYWAFNFAANSGQFALIF